MVDTLPDGYLENLLVDSMTDGGMGSLRLCWNNTACANRVFYRVASECHFKDSDNNDVIASIYVDEHGVPFELDVWKTTLSSLLRIPEKLPKATVPSA
ncbi:MAG: hypothetical protein IPM33_00335 [Phycisphaerales bacterium]|nr:hypothetical protein [Phycisphaerales bacterium]